MQTILRSFASLLVLAAAAAAQQLPPIQPLGPVLATSVEPLGSVSQVRALPGGRVLVNDNTGRRVLMFDSTLTHFSVIADTTSATANAYGSRLGGLIAYRGDSTLFVDPASLSMLVIDPTGKITRTMAAPRPNDVNNLIGGPFGTPGFDALGRLVYRANIQPIRMTAPGPGGAFQMPTLPDSALIVRFDLTSRKLDTVVKFAIPKIVMNMTRDENTNNITVTSTVNPIPWTDDWALLSDGTVAVIRGRDYRVDLVGPDGKVTAGPKLPHDWQRLSDEDKTAIIDSTRKVLEVQRAAMLAQLQGSSADGKATSDTGKTAGGRQRPMSDAGGGAMQITIRGGLGGPGGPGGGRGAPSSFSMPLNFVSLNDMPDYRPVFRQGASRGDDDDQLWIRTSKSVNGGTVYDVIDRKGELTRRVLVPPGRVIAGFGPGGVVYMGVVDGSITRLERARMK